MEHYSVLLNEAIESLNIKKDGIRCEKDYFYNNKLLYIEISVKLND